MVNIFCEMGCDFTGFFQQQKDGFDLQNFMGSRPWFPVPILPATNPERYGAEGLIYLNLLGSNQINHWLVVYLPL